MATIFASSFGATYVVACGHLYPQLLGSRFADAEEELAVLLLRFLIFRSRHLTVLTCSKEKPTLGGTRIKTRKRNIAVPLDPSSFADAVVQIYLEHQGDLELIAKDVEASDLDFSRYGDTFFEELYGPDDRKKLAVFTALTFSQKLSGLPPETIFSALLSDSLIAKGTVLGFVTDSFKEYLVDNTLDDLIGLLKRAKMEDRLLDFFPMQKRTIEAFAEHFSKEGLGVLVDYNTKKVFDVKLKELRTTLTDQIAENIEPTEVVEMVKQRRRECALPDVDVVRTIWDAIMDAVQWSGKNQQQNSNLALRQVKTWGKLLGTFCTTAKLEMDLMYKIQIHCYEDAKLMKLFPEIIRALYDQDVLAEDTVLVWFRKGTNPKGRQTFVKGLESFVKWLEEAEEED
ncbi:hypothetical protein AXG93_891s1100 [Marchantia polymorpha subsp. ruderalis]|uniref:W2 domain-containing protein n=1 Tax=Marchantia polymorpha subsp. ruderalis TaxID=1480154 RepID=A0A176VM14_MARPO|nr:hypothetical protein AXG93_891s1100 [Marchantia polymorpha subsp. ruderalis]